MNHVFSFLEAKCHQSENRPVLMGERSACITLCCKFFCWDESHVTDSVSYQLILRFIIIIE